MSILKETIKEIIHQMDEEGVWNSEEKLIIVKQFTEFYKMYKTIIEEYSLNDQPDFQAVVDLLFYLNTEYNTFTTVPIHYDVCCETFNRILENIRNSSSHLCTHESICNFVTIEAFGRLKWYQLVFVIN